MKMTAHRRALDKIYKRRDRYEIPDWQRGEVWDSSKKQQLIDSILRGWRLPKFYFVATSEEEYEVVDGQQRLSAIYEFFANDLALTGKSTIDFGGPLYKDLKPKYSDAFDDFEIDYDQITDASEEELKHFFQRLQQGLPLTSSEKLNSMHSKLRDFCKAISKHDFLKKSVSVADTRFAHFDIASKAAVIEIEGIGAGLRFDDIKPVFEAQRTFSTTSAVAKRLREALDLLSVAFRDKEPLLKNRTVVQSTITFTCCLVASGRAARLGRPLATFLKHFMSQLTTQVELGQAATDYDFMRFQQSISANVKAGARTRQEILLRKAFMYNPEFANAFDPGVLVESGMRGRVKELGDALAAQITRMNSSYAAEHGEDLFKATNKTIAALNALGKPIEDLTSYESMIDDLYFIFKESIGQRLTGVIPNSFVDVNSLRTELRHDTDHGDAGKVRAKKKHSGSVFKKYAGDSSPETLDPIRFVLVQVNLLSALEVALTNLVVPKV